MLLAIYCFLDSLLNCFMSVKGRFCRFSGYMLGICLRLHKFQVEGHTEAKNSLKLMGDTLRCQAPIHPLQTIDCIDW